MKTPFPDLCAACDVVKTTENGLARPIGVWMQWRVVFKRELQAALLNRFVHLLSAAALATGIAPLLGDHPGDSAPYFLLQAILYLMPLFALLIGAGAAQSDLEERAFLFTQPVGRLTILLGKWTALWMLLALAAGLMLLPYALGESALAPLGFLWLGAAGVGGIFLALGFAFGFSTRDRVKAHLGALCAWLFLLAGFDLLALAGVQAGFLGDHPSLWLSLLMSNPLDAFRIGSLFAIDRVPFDLAQAPLPGRWCLTYPMAWLALLSGVWIALALGWSRLKLDRIEE